MNATLLNTRSSHTTPRPILLHGSLLIILAFGFMVAPARSQWVRVNDGLQSLSVYCLTTIDSTVFVGTAKGLYRSADAGTHWTFVGPDTTAVLVAATDGVNLLVKSDSVLALSSNAGGSWTRINMTTLGSWRNRMSAIGIEGSMVIVGTNGTIDGGAVMMFRSTDLGVSWTAQTAPLPSFHHRGGVIRILPRDSVTFMAMRDEEGTGDIYWSVDGCANWTALPRFPMVSDRWVRIDDFDARGTTLFVTLGFYTGGAGLRTSTDGGSTWSTIFSPSSPWMSLYELALNDRSVMTVGTIESRDSVYRGIRNGSKWMNISGELCGLRVGSLAMTTSDAYAAVWGQGVYRFSLKGALGISISDAENWGQPGTQARVVMTDSTGSVIRQGNTAANSTVQFSGILDNTGYAYRVYAYPSGQWGEQFWGGKTNVEITASDTARDAFIHNTPYMPSVAVYVDSTNELLPDSALKALPAGTRVRFELTIKNPSYSGARPVSAYGVVRLDRDRDPPFDLTVNSGTMTLDTGKTAKAVFTCLTPSTPGPYAFSVATYASSSSYPASLTDASGWHDAPFAVISAPSLVYPSNGTASLPTSLTLRWHRSEGAARYRLRLAENAHLDSGMVVNDSTIVDTTYAVSGLKLNAQYYWRVETIANTVPGGPSPVWMFRTAQVLPGRPELVHPSQNAVLNSMVVGFVWRKASPDVVRYWHELATDSSFMFRMADTTITDTVFVRTGLATGNYWWRVRALNAAGWGTFSDTMRFKVSVTDVGSDRAVPKDYSLAQNYPNPFNPATMIRFGLPQASHVTIAVFNPLGQQVATIVDHAMDAGYHEVAFDASRLPSGIYLYRMKAGEFTATRRLVVVK